MQGTESHNNCFCVAILFLTSEYCNADCELRRSEVLRVYRANILPREHLCSAEISSRKTLPDFSCRCLPQSVFVMQTAQNWASYRSAFTRNAVP